MDSRNKGSGLGPDEHGYIEVCGVTFTTVGPVSTDCMLAIIALQIEAQTAVLDRLAEAIESLGVAS